VGEQRGPWTVLSSRLAYSNPWIEVREHEVIDPGGQPSIYGVMSSRTWALGVLPVFADGTVALVGQHRFTINTHSWEIPQGGGDKRVSPLAAASRELREECGLVARGWQQVLRMHLSNSVTDEFAISFLAWDLGDVDASLESSESDLRVERVPYRQLVERVATGDITDSVTVATTLKVEVMRLSGDLPDAVRNALGS
jgi:ADP-ribose pyrophosphatase